MRFLIGKMERHEDDPDNYEIRDSKELIPFVVSEVTELPRSMSEMPVFPETLWL